MHAMIRTHSCTTHADNNAVHTHHGISLVNATQHQHAARLLARAADNWNQDSPAKERWRKERKHKASRPFRQGSSRTNPAGTCKSPQARFQQRPGKVTSGVLVTRSFGVRCRHDTSAAGNHWATRWEHASAEEKRAPLSWACWDKSWAPVFFLVRAVVMCRAESSARASGRLQVIIIAAAAAMCCVDGWVDVQKRSYRRRLRAHACLHACPVCRSRVAPFGASYNRGYLGLKVARRRAFCWVRRGWEAWRVARVQVIDRVVSVPRATTQRTWRAGVGNT